MFVGEERARLAELLQTLGLKEIHLGRESTSQERHLIESFPRKFRRYEDFRCAVHALRAQLNDLWCRFQTVVRILRMDHSRVAVVDDAVVITLNSVVRCLHDGVLPHPSLFDVDHKRILLCHGQYMWPMDTQFSEQEIRWFVTQTEDDTKAACCTSDGPTRMCPLCKRFVHPTCCEVNNRKCICPICKGEVGGADATFLRDNEAEAYEVGEDTPLDRQALVEDVVSRFASQPPRLITMSPEDLEAVVRRCLPDDDSHDVARSDLRCRMVRGPEVARVYLSWKHPECFERLRDDALFQKYLRLSELNNIIKGEYEMECHCGHKKVSIRPYDDARFCSESCIEGYKVYMELLQEAALEDRNKVEDGGVARATAENWNMAEDGGVARATAENWNMAEDGGVARATAENWNMAEDGGFARATAENWNMAEDGGFARATAENWNMAEDGGVARATAVGEEEESICAICHDSLGVAGQVCSPCVTSDKHVYHVACWRVHEDYNRKWERLLFCPLCMNVV